MEVQKDADGNPLVRRVDRKPRKLSREVCLLPGFSSHLAVPGLGRFVAGKARVVSVLESTLDQLSKSRCWEINQIVLGETVARLEDGAIAMVTKGKPGGPFLVQVPGEDLERRDFTAEQLEDRVHPAEFLKAVMEIEQAKKESVAKPEPKETKPKGTKK